MSPFSRKKVYGRKYEDFKRLDNDPFDLQALKMKARHFNATPCTLAMERLAVGLRRSYPNKRAISGVMQQYAAPLSTSI